MTDTGEVPIDVPCDRDGSLEPSAIESLHMRLGKIIKTRGHFHSEDAATKLVWRCIGG